MQADDWLPAVREEVEALHRFFVDWFTGAVAADTFEAGFLARLDPDFVLIPPAGEVLTLELLAGAVRERHASNPDFRIAIRNVRVRRVWDSTVLATYEEWQRNALATTPPDNARVASVLFRAGEPLCWLHVHETRMPASADDDYDF